MYSEKAIAPRPREIIGRSLDECRDRLYQKYGKNYEIVDWEKTLKGGFLGLFSHMVVRVSYTVDDRFDMAPSAVPQRTEKHPYDRSPYPQSGGNYYSRDGMSIAKPAAPAESFATARDRILESQIGKGVTPTNLIQVAQLTKQIENLDKKIEAISLATSGQEDHQTLSRIEELLLQNEFTVPYIKKLKARIRNELSLEELDDFDLVQSKVVEWIGEGIQIAPKYASKTKAKSCHVIVIVGPTGVGKTTTVAKMAAKLMVNSKEKTYTPRILLISIDTMKVGAVAQLEHWGETMGLDVRKAMTPSDLQALYDEYKNKMDFIFIDTSGYSHYDLENIAKMHKILAVDGMKPDMYLAVSAGTKARDLEGIVRNYESFEFRSIIITKCDETSAYGNVLSVLAEKGKGVSMLTDGQKVLHSLRRAHPYYFLRSLSGFQVDKAQVLGKFGPLEDEDEGGGAAG